MKLKVKKNLKVVVITGKDKGKQGKVLLVKRDKNLVVVEGVNVKIKHLKKTNDPSKPQGRVEVVRPISISNVKVIEDVKEIKKEKEKQGIKKIKSKIIKKK